MTTEQPTARAEAERRYLPFDGDSEYSAMMEQLQDAYVAGWLARAEAAAPLEEALREIRGELEGLESLHESIGIVLGKVERALSSPSGGE
jgi:hypothetical protein